MGLAATVAPHREPATQGFAQGVEGFGNTAGSDDPVTPAISVTSSWSSGVKPPSIRSMQPIRAATDNCVQA
jgi:hypothetical protein